MLQVLYFNHLGEIAEILFFPPGCDDHCLSWWMRTMDFASSRIAFNLSNKTRRAMGHFMDRIFPFSAVLEQHDYRYHSSAAMLRRMIRD
jgi:hypothetical protein